MTIINPRDMTRHYFVWGVSLTVVVIAAAVMYSYQPAALLQVVPEVFKPILLGVAIALGTVALSLKFVFAHEMVAWVLLESIAVIGTVIIGLFGYADWWLLYYGAAFAGLFVLGPYLHFD